MTENFCPGQETELADENEETDETDDTGFCELFSKGFGEDDTCKINLKALRALRTEMSDLSDLSDAGFCSLLYFVVNPGVAITTELSDFCMEPELVNYFKEVYDAYAPVVHQQITNSTVRATEYYF